MVSVGAAGGSGKFRQSPPYLPPPAAPPLQNIISGSHLELSISNPPRPSESAAAAYFRSMPPPGPGAPPQENYLRSIERLQLRAQMEEKGERSIKLLIFPPMWHP